MRVYVSMQPCGMCVCVCVCVCTYTLCYDNVIHCAYMQGSGLLYVAKPLQSSIRPLVISHGFGSGFCGEFSWTGQQQFIQSCAYLCY